MMLLYCIITIRCSIIKYKNVSRQFDSRAKVTHKITFVLYSYYNDDNNMIYLQVNSCQCETQYYVTAFWLGIKVNDTEVCSRGRKRCVLS